MASVSLILKNPINTSLQAKSTGVATNTDNNDSGAWDIIYFVKVAPNGKTIGSVYKLGECVSITPGIDTYTLTVNVESGVQTPGAGDFIFFGKNNKIGTSGVVGYFTEVEMKNDSLSNAELFAVNSEITQSSK